MAEPGWYDDGQGKQRWFDGLSWTDRVQSPTGSTEVEPLKFLSPIERDTADRSAEFGFVSPIDGRNARVFIFSDRVEWVLTRARGKIVVASRVIAIHQVVAVTGLRVGLTWSMLVLRTAAGSFRFRAAHKTVEQARATINRHLLDGVQATSARAPEPRATSKVDELAKLADLLKQGLLTDAEFAAAKADLIG